jgi:UDP-hydrolysing UDP-N-acetyl-D-glucosamine 2-epimerase
MDIVVISGSRADRGPLKPVVEALKAELIFLPHYEVSNPSDAALSASHACHQTVSLLYEREVPDFAIVLGDRHEVLGAVTALNLMNIPIAHLSGGDITEGSQDNAMRHAITKLSHIHFPTNTDAAARIIDMGEESWRVFTVGCPGIDKVLATELIPKEEVCRRLGITAPYILVSYQPATLSDDPIEEAQILLDYLSVAGMPCVFASVNPDAFSTHIGQMFANFSVRHNGIIFDMPQRLYLSAMKHCEYMIGNSSSGFYEAPTLKVPFINIGDRQKGRIAAANILSVQAKDIAAAVTHLHGIKMLQITNPYGDGHAAEHIASIMRSVGTINRRKLLTKRWVQHDVQSDMGKDSPGKDLGILPERRLGALDIPVIRSLQGIPLETSYPRSWLRSGE